VYKGNLHLQITRVPLLPHASNWYLWDRTLESRASSRWEISQVRRGTRHDACRTPATE